jgi:large exoprotein involved in heme utilization and adhesion
MSTYRPQSQSRAKSGWLPSLNLTGLWRRRVALLPRQGRLMTRRFSAETQILEKRTLLTTIIAQNWNSNGGDIAITDSSEIIINSGVILNTASSTGAAGNITLSAPKIVIQSGAILETSSSIGQAGSISLSASRPSSDALSINANSPSITVNAGAQLLATGTTSANNGAITLDANGTVPDAKWAIWAQAEDIYEWSRGANATITINQTAAISGGNVTISTAAGDQFKTQNMVNSYTGGVAGKAEELRFNDKPSARGSNSGLSDECELGEM